VKPLLPTAVCHWTVWASSVWDLGVIAAVISKTNYRLNVCRTAKKSAALPATVNQPCTVFAA